LKNSPSRPNTFSPLIGRFIVLTTETIEMAICARCGEMLSASTPFGVLCSQCRETVEAARQAVAPLPKARYPVTKILTAVTAAVSIVLLIADAHSKSLDLFFDVGNWGPFTLSGQWWRLLTSNFAHMSVAHLLGNLLFLWMLGKRLEQILRSWIFLLFYLSCGLVSGIASLAIHPEVSTVGASTGIFGLAGGLISVHGLKGLTLSKKSRWKLALLVLWTAFSIFPDAGADNVGHAAGLLTGLILGAVLMRFPTPEQSRRVFAALAVLLVLAAASVRYYNRDVVLLADALRFRVAGRADDALKQAIVVLQRRPNSEIANRMAGDIYLEKQDYADAEAAAQRVLAFDPDDDHATSLLGMVELRTGRCSQARGRAYRLVRDYKRHRETVDMLTADCNHTAEGDRNLTHGDADSAIQSYREALKENPDNPDAQLGLVKAYRANGMKNDADAAAAKFRRLESPSH
jgi:membrane associated rhomboid family serine protease/Flp pilus assembly protein TadD